MKKLLFLLLFALTANCIQAQIVSSWPTEEGEFLKEMDKYMNGNKREDCHDAMKDFAGMYKTGKVNSALMKQVIVTANIMAGRSMAANPYYLNYLQTVMAFVNTGKSGAAFTEWSTILNDLAKNAKRGDNRDFEKFIRFSNAFFSQNALFVTGSKTWRVDNRDYKISTVSGVVKFSFPSTRFCGIVNGDSVEIFKTIGEFYPFENKWVGRGGVVTWTRAGIESAKVYATLKNYTIILDNFGYSADSVEFTHLEYFQKPLLGKLTDKLVTNNDTSKSTYPRFESYDFNISIKEIAPQVSYNGGFNMFGNKVIGFGTEDNKSSFTFYQKDGKTKLLTARSTHLTIKRGEELGSEKAEVYLFFDKDTLYHPQLTLTYKIKSRELRMLRGEAGIGKSKFTDTYHNFEIATDGIFWNLDSTRLNMKILSGVGQNPSLFESVNYFSKDKIRQIQGVAQYEPLSRLKLLADKKNTKELSAEDIAKSLSATLGVEQVKSLLYGLVEGGFITYNEPTGMVTLKDKTINYVLANAKKIDYDIIKIASLSKTGNDYIDLKSKNIDLKGTKYVPISDSSGVSFYPKNQELTLIKDRGMDFDGLVYAGRMDLIGEKYKFNYAPFTVNLNKVDTMRINIPRGDTLDEYGMPLLKMVKSKVEDIKGLLEVDAPINKSGRAHLPQFPKLTSREKSHVFYDNPEIAHGAYLRKDFFFEVEPFKLDSLNYFTPSTINWKGKLVSAGIFPDFNESIKIQPDLSLGFHTETPTAGYAIYKDKGKYAGGITLNWSGLSGKGDVSHSTSAFSSQNIMFYPDSLKAIADTFHIAKVSDGVKTPEVHGGNLDINWKTKSDSMAINMKDRPIAMYEKQTSLKGNLLLTSRGLYGNGTLDWSEANLKSKGFAFTTDNLEADTSELNIKSAFGDKVTFKTPNVQAKVDFKNKIGDFKSNLANIPTEFAYNQYSTAINEFKWDMVKKFLEFKAPPNGNGVYFTSTNPSQLGLKFLSKRATYDLTTSILTVEQIPQIVVADAGVVPDSGKVVIGAEAKMKQLKNATIYVDTANKRMKIENATVDIVSKNEMKGSGKYKYSTGNIKDEVITFSEFGSKQETIGEKKKKEEVYHFTAKGEIKEGQKFQIYPDVTFNGEVNLLSTDSLLNFKGYTKIGFKNKNAETSDFAINQLVNPEELMLRIDSLKSKDAVDLNVGVCYNKGETPSMYTNIVAPKLNVADVQLFKANGICYHNPKTNEYLFGDKAKIRDKAMRGNVLKFDDAKGMVNCEGKINLGFNFGLIKYDAAGTIENDINKKSYKFNLTFGLDMRMDKNLNEKLSNILFNDDIDLPDMDYNTDRFKKQLNELVERSQNEKYYQEMEKTNIFKRNKDLYYNLVFTDVNMVFDSVDQTIRSTGKIGLSFAGEKVIHKKVDGYIEMGWGVAGDFFNIYMKTGANEWFYFSFKPGMLGLLSSYDDFNSMIGAMDGEKRKVKGENNQFYMFSIGSSVNKQTFVDAMKEKQGGVGLQDYKPKPKAAPLPVSKDSVDEKKGDGSKLSPPPANRNAETPKQPEQQYIKSDGSKLSEPPPGRNTAPPVTKDTTSKAPTPPPVVKDTVAKTVTPPPTPAAKDTTVKPASPAPVKDKTDSTPPPSTPQPNSPPAQPATPPTNPPTTPAAPKQ